MLRDPAHTDVVPRTLATRPSAARAAAVAQAVAPLVGAALALHREFVECARPEVAAALVAAAIMGSEAAGTVARADAPPCGQPPFERCAAQLLASAHLLAECVRRAGGTIRARRGDAVADSAADLATLGVDSPPDLVGHLLAAEHEFARGLRRAIATCDAQADDRTADCLEEVLDEVRWQQSVLSGLLPARRATNEPSR